MANFVSTLDGVVSLGRPGQSGGSEISGANPPDRALMGLLRAVADAVVVGAGTFRAVPGHVWTPERIYPPFAAAYAELRARLGLAENPLNVIVTARGDLDLTRRVFSSGQVPVLVVTTPNGAAQLRQQAIPPRVQIAEAPGFGDLTPTVILEAIGRVQPTRVVLVEGGPRLLGDFLAARALDELFLTLAPQVAGRAAAVERPGLVAGREFAPDHPLWGSLADARRAASHLFLRYTFATK